MSSILLQPIIVANIFKFLDLYKEDDDWSVRSRIYIPDPPYIHTLFAYASLCRRSAEIARTSLNPLFYLHWRHLLDLTRIAKRVTHTFEGNADMCRKQPSHQGEEVVPHLGWPDRGRYYTISCPAHHCFLPAHYSAWNITPWLLPTTYHPERDYRHFIIEVVQQRMRIFLSDHKRDHEDTLEIAMSWKRHVEASRKNLAEYKRKVQAISKVTERMRGVVKPRRTRQPVLSQMILRSHMATRRGARRGKEE